MEQEHIDKIVDAYAKRENIDKFAHVADMSEIIENGYNLNISRYVSTTMPEKEIDLADVHKKMIAVDEQIKAATEKHNTFLKELGLPLLP